MKLVDQERVDLDAPLADYLPAFEMLSPEYRDVTVRMLLNHSSGFGGTDGRNAFMSVPFSGSGAQLMETLRGERLKHEPGYLSVYCNDGFTMIENLVEAITGRSYPEFVHNEILAPLGMTRSLFARRTGDLAPGTYAESYVNGVLMTPEFVNLYATGGLYSTPSDMARLAMMLMNGGAVGTTRILSAASVAEMGTDQTSGTFNPQPTDFIRFGLGWDSVCQPGMKAVGIRGWYKNGGTLAYTAEFIVLPEERLAVMVCTDHNGGARSLKTAERILLRALVERETIAAMPEPLTAAVPPENPEPPGDEEAVSGFYAANMALYRVRFDEDHSLFVDTYSDSEWKPKYSGLKLRTDGWYTSDEAPLASIRPLAAEGRRYLAVRGTHGLGHYLIQVMHSEKLETKPAANPEWEARVGETYLISNADIHDLALMGEGTDPRFTLTALPGLPGYLFTGAMDVVDASADAELARMFLLIPQNNGRDLSDIRVVPGARGGEEWLRTRSILYRPLSGVAELPDGVSTIAIDNDGHAEWRKVPAFGSISIMEAGGWAVYDSDFEMTASGSDEGVALLPGWGTVAYLMVTGMPGCTIVLDLHR
jgi:CubicO group peptidase (beta-lactamase class C family)